MIDLEVCDVVEEHRLFCPEFQKLCFHLSFGSMNKYGLELVKSILLIKGAKSSSSEEIPLPREFISNRIIISLIMCTLSK